MEGISIREQFATLEDPRVERTKQHQLLDIITIALCAVICGADTWVDIEAWGQAKQAWLETFRVLLNGIPSHDTFGRVFARLNPEQFQRCFLDWVQAVNSVLPMQQIALDGKTVRRSHDRSAGKKAIHMVSAWASANRLVLAQVKVEEKSNEIPAIPALLAQLELAGCIVSIENSVHWVLDIAFDEDHSRMRKDNSPENFAVPRHMALNLLKHERTAKCGTKAKRLKAGWSEDYLCKVLTA